MTLVMNVPFSVTLVLSFALYSCGNNLAPEVYSKLQSVHGAKPSQHASESDFLSTTLNLSSASTIQPGDKLEAELDLKTDVPESGQQDQPLFMIQNQNGETLASARLNRLSDFKRAVGSDDTDISITFVNRNPAKSMMTVNSVKLFAVRDGKRIEVGLPPFEQWSKSARLETQKDTARAYVLMGTGQQPLVPNAPSQNEAQLGGAANPAKPASGTTATQPTGSTTATQPTGSTAATQPTEPTCGMPNNSCYDNLTAMSAGQARLVDGTKIVLTEATVGFKVWRDLASNKILKASGLYQQSGDWQKKLQKSGYGYDGDFLDYKILAGRACPEMIYRADYSPVSEDKAENCLYYDAGKTKSVLGQEPSKFRNVGIEKTDWMWIWSTTWGDLCVNRCRTPLYFQGNIRVCNIKGMRLPTIYEADVDLDHLPFQIKYGLPRVKSHVDQWLTQGGATYPQPGKGVPAVPGGYTFTASGVWQPLFTSQYFVFNSQRHPEKSSFNAPQNVRCVLPP